jgi:hypothetical protein
MKSIHWNHQHTFLFSWDYPFKALPTPTLIYNMNLLELNEKK